MSLLKVSITHYQKWVIWKKIRVLDFRNEYRASFLHGLQYLYNHSGYFWTGIFHRTFCLIQNDDINFNEMFQHGEDLNDDYFSFNQSVFPLQKAISFWIFMHISCKGIVALLQSWSALETVQIWIKTWLNFMQNILLLQPTI